MDPLVILAATTLLLVGAAYRPVGLALLELSRRLAILGALALLTVSSTLAMAARAINRLAERMLDYAKR